MSHTSPTARSSQVWRPTQDRVAPQDGAGANRVRRVVAHPDVSLPEAVEEALVAESWRQDAGDDVDSAEELGFDGHRDGTLT